MRGLKILDCTLRDGGYCNNWTFEKRNIDKIVNALREARIDLIEYGYLDDGASLDIHSTRFASLDRIPEQLDENGLVMINYGEVDINAIPQNDGKVFGIRVAFHKRNSEEALLLCSSLKQKGYRIFVQPMVTNRYSMDEFRSIIEEVNKIKPEAFYIVDSFGSMQDEEVKQYMELADEILCDEIGIGFHGHDNSRQAFLNAVTAINVCQRHFVYIDSTIMGMGRGAGNLGTENIIGYCNKHWQTNYNIQPLLKIIDEVLNHFYAEKPWGYTLPFYLAARHNCHPNYALYLDNRKTLTVTGMDEIFARLSDEKKVSFDKEYIEKVYYEYMNKEAFDYQNEDLWKKHIEGKKVLLLAPGQTIRENADRILSFIEKERPVVISVNFDYEQIKSDYVFMSNQRRYDEWQEKRNHSSKLIVTSNVPAERYFLKVKYLNLLSKEEIISDNAGMMAVRFLMQYYVSHVILAGFDGYQYDEHLNYADQKMKMETVNDRKSEMNELIKNELEKIGKLIDLESLTPSIYFE